jgi:hypothetical protein
VLGAGTGNANPFESLGSSDPSQILSSLRGVATVTTVGPDTVRGTPTTHFRANVDVAKAAQAEGLNAVQKQQLQRALGGQNTVPEDVWIDDQGLVRRLAVDLGTAPAGTPSPGKSSSPTAGRSRVQAEFYDFGKAATTVTPPPADDVVDFSRILEQFGSLGAGTGATPS